MRLNTVEPPNKGHFGTNPSVHCREDVLFSEVSKCIIIATFRTLRSVLYERMSLSGGSFIGGFTCKLQYLDSNVNWPRRWWRIWKRERRRRLLLPPAALWVQWPAGLPLRWWGSTGGRRRTLSAQTSGTALSKWESGQSKKHRENLMESSTRILVWSCIVVDSPSGECRLGHVQE